MKIFKFFFLSVILIFTYSSRIIGQNFIPKQIVNITLKSSKKGYKINFADVVLIPNTGGTITRYQGVKKSNNQYVVEIPIGIAPDFQLIINSPDHQEYKGIVFSNQTLEITLQYNNYYKEFSVDETQVIEIFTHQIVQLNQNEKIYAGYSTSKRDEMGFEFYLPMPSKWLTRNLTSPDIIPIIYYEGERENMYYDLLKEIILQTTAARNGFASSKIKDWINKNYGKFGGTKLPDLDSHIHTLVDIFGESFQENAKLLSKGIKSVNFVYELEKALEEGSLEAILKYLAFETYQQETFEILKKISLKSKLANDIAFKNAILKLESKLPKERKKRLNELVTELRKKKAKEFVLKNVFSGLVVKAFSSMAGVSSISGTLLVAGIIDMFSGVASSNKMQASLILLSQIDHYLFKNFFNKYIKNNDEVLKNNRKLYYGSLMRIHCGYMFNKIRAKYYKGKDQGLLVGGIKNILMEPFRRKMAEVSSNKFANAAYNYYRTSLIMPDLTTPKFSNNVLLGFILDSSGSMKESDPYGIRKSAVKQIIDILNGSEKVFITDFDDNAKWVNSNNWQSWNKNDLKKSIDLIDSDGGTNIGMGIKNMQMSISDKLSHGDRASVILLTDGKGTYNNEALWFGQQGIPIYTISYKNNADSKLMNEIAKTTNGVFIKANNSGDIVSAFTQFYNELVGNSKFVNYEDIIMPGQIINLPNGVYVEKGCAKMYGSNFWTGSKIGLTLISPSGKVYNEKNNNGEWNLGINYATVKVNNPEGGMWKVKFEGIDVPVLGEKFSFELSGQSPNQINLDNTTVKEGHIEFTIKDALNTINMSSLKPTIEVLTPKNKIKNISNSYKNGKINYLAMEGKGEYQFSIKIKGKDRKGNKIQRHFNRTILVGNFVPSFIGRVTNIMGAVIKSDLGSKIENRSGIKCYIYQPGNNKRNKKAVGYVSFVGKNYCQIEIQQLFGSSQIRKGDVVELDVKQWSGDFNN